MLSGGVINPRANAWKLGVGWGWMKTANLLGDNVVWGDNHASSETRHFMTRTKYSQFINTNDNLFVSVAGGGATEGATYSSASAFMVFN